VSSYLEHKQRILELQAECHGTGECQLVLRSGDFQNRGDTAAR